MVIFGATGDLTRSKLIPALQNQPLMTTHVSLAILAYATFSVAFAAAVLYLIENRWHVAWLPSADLLDDLGFRAVTVGCSATIERSSRITTSRPSSLAT